MNTNPPEDNSLLDLLRGRGIQELMELVRDALARDAVREIDAPHIVICFDPNTRYITYSGPYERAMDALVAADYERQREVAADPTSQLEFSIAPLYQPLTIALPAEKPDR